MGRVERRERSVVAFRFETPYLDLEIYRLLTILETSPAGASSSCSHYLRDTNREFSSFAHAPMAAPATAYSTPSALMSNTLLTVRLNGVSICER
jgi:hypothetical protein